MTSHKKIIMKLHKNLKYNVSQDFQLWRHKSISQIYVYIVTNLVLPSYYYYYLLIFLLGFPSRFSCASKPLWIRGVSSFIFPLRRREFWSAFVCVQWRGSFVFVVLSVHKFIYLNNDDENDSDKDNDIMLMIMLEQQQE